MKTLIITAMFDIQRSSKGDGRTIEQYLEWFSRTLKLKCDMIIFTEEKFKHFVYNNRKVEGNKTYVAIQKLEEVPFYHHNDEMKQIISSDFFKQRMKDLNRIECYLSEYNVIQYSKFGWLKKASEKLPEYDYYFWMDAGCSRFFDGFDFSRSWPEFGKISKDKVTIQGNFNYTRLFDSMNIEEYIWDNNSLLVGTLFGANRDNVQKLYTLVEETYQFMVSRKCINNEQFALAILAKKYPEMFDIKIQLNQGHLPIFRIL